MMEEFLHLRSGLTKLVPGIPVIEQEYHCNLLQVLK